jgi:hypothetical protein
MTNRVYALVLLWLASSCQEPPTDGGRLLEFPTPGGDSGGVASGGMAGEAGAGAKPSDDTNAGSAGAGSDDR